MIHLKRGQTQETIAALKKAPPGWSGRLDRRGIGGLANGNRKEAQTIVDELNEREKKGGYIRHTILHTSVWRQMIATARCRGWKKNTSPLTQ